MAAVLLLILYLLVVAMLPAEWIRIKSMSMSKIAGRALRLPR